MRKITLALIVAGLIGHGGIPVFADDANSDRPVESHRKMMTDCINKERAANTGASQDQLKKICEAKIKSYDNHPSETTLPPDNPGR